MRIVMYLLWLVWTPVTRPIAWWLRVPEDAQLAALSALDLHGESSAVEVWDAIVLDSSIPQPKRQLKRRHIYSVVRALEDAGFASARLSPPVPARGNRPQVLYTITDKGRERLAERA